MMNRYEILILATPAITQDEAKNVEKSIETIIKTAKGEVISFERWGKCRLAYPVKKNDYGIYFLTRFELEADKKVFNDIRTAFVVKYNEIVMRYALVKLDPKQSLEYKRPQSVEETPTRDVDSFLRENKMEGLLSSVDKKETDSAAKPAAPSTEATKETVAAVAPEATTEAPKAAKTLEAADKEATTEQPKKDEESN